MSESIYKIPEIAPQLERGPLWLRKFRRDSQVSFNDGDLPRRGLHLWRYTDPSKFMVDSGQTVDSVIDTNSTQVAKTELEHFKQGHLSALAIDLGGREIKVHISDELKNDGVIISSLSDAVEQHTDLVQPYLYELVNSKTGKFEALNGALWNDGIFIYIPKNTSAAKPIHLLREAGGENSIQFPRLLVVAEESSEVTIIDEYGGGSNDFEKGASHANGAVEIHGLQNSRVRYVNLQRQGSAAQTYLTHRAHLARNANMLTVALTFGGLICKQNFGATLNGENAESTMIGVSFGTKHQHFDTHTLHHHKVGHTLSNIDYKVVLRDRALSAYTGLIKIDNQAKTCEAYQENRNLLLSPNTKAETIPELEILNEDVKCSHGATIGPIDPMQIFFLQARGIAKEEATRMVVSGFVASTLKLLPDDLKERVAEFVAERLENL